MSFSAFCTMNQTDSQREAAMNWSVYTITEVASGKKYVGRTQNPGNRWASHLMSLATGRHQNVLLQDAWNKGRPDGFDFEIVVSGLDDSSSVTTEEAMIAEWIAAKLCFNINLGSVGGNTLTNHPDRDRIIERRTETTRGLIEAMTETERAERFGRNGSENGMYGRHHTEEARKAISKASIGHSRNRGIKRTPEQRKRMSEIASQRTGKLNPFYGRSHTEQARRRMAEARTGLKPINRRRVSISGELFDSVSEAARSIGVSSSLMVYRLKSSKWEAYQYVSEKL